MALASVNFNIPAVASTASNVPLARANGSTPFSTWSTLQASVAAAVAVGAGDNSTNVTSINTSVQTLTPLMTGDACFIYDPAKLTTANQLDALVAAIMDALNSLGLK